MPIRRVRRLARQALRSLAKRGVKMYAVDSPQRPRWRRPVRWLLGTFTAAAIGFIAAVAFTAVVVFQQYPAKVSAPDTVLGLPKANEIAEGFRPSFPGVVQAYADADHTRAVVVAAQQTLILRPASRLSGALRKAAGQFDTTGEVADVPT